VVQKWVHPKKRRLCVFGRKSKSVDPLNIEPETPNAAKNRHQRSKRFGQTPTTDRKMTENHTAKNPE